MLLLLLFDEKINFKYLPLDNVDYVKATAENMPSVADASVDFVACAQAAQ